MILRSRGQDAPGPRAEAVGGGVVAAGAVRC
jgi:hypothetical protein